MKYERLARDIIQKVGGKENVISVVHCITRLRFKLKDEGKADTAGIKSMDGVVTVMQSGGQYQVVIGNHVPDVYKDVVEIGGFAAQKEVPQDDNQGGSLFNRFIDIIASIFTPVLGVLAATGMIKGFNALFVSLGWLTATSGTYQILNAIGDSLFYFFPIFLGYTASKKFGGAPFIGIAIGASLVYPTLGTLTQGEPLYTLFTGTMFESPVYITFLGIPVILMSYSSSVIPIILAVYFSSKVEKGLRRAIPDVVKTFLVPFFTLLIVVPITFIVIGPIATWASQLIGKFTLLVSDISPVVAGAVVGGLWQILVIFGLHWGLIPIIINNLSTLQADPIIAMVFTPSFAQIGAVLGVWIRTKNQKIRSLSIPAFISGIFGVTEPAIYGITLPKKRPFIISCIAAAVGSAIVGVFGAKGFRIGGLGVFGIPSFISPTEGINTAFWSVIAAIIIAFLLAFVLTYLFGGVDKETVPMEEGVPVNPDGAKKTATTIQQDDLIDTPIAGKVLALCDIEDEAFSTGAMGQGLAILPTEGKVYAPASGEVSALFPKKHAMVIKTNNGTEILIHIGMDTVQLGGKFFTAHVKQGDRIEKGQLLLEFDINQITEAGYKVTSPIIITNLEDAKLILTQNGEVKKGDSLMTVVRR